MKSLPPQRWKLLLGILLAACITKFWLLPIGSSFWVDEMVTAFVVHHGAGDSSLRVAPQVVASDYYWLPWITERLFGFSELSYRIPSALALLIALWLVAKISARLIHPDAAWFTVFCAFTLRGFNYEASDARPYALATLIAAAAIWFLIMWLDTAKWPPGILFVVSGALVWRAHLINWPFYLLFALYAGFRLWRKETPLGWKSVLAGFVALGVALLPTLFSALSILRQAGAHVILEGLPRLRDLTGAYKFGLVIGCGIGAWLLFNWFFQTAQAKPVGVSAAVVIGAWWLLHPLALFLYSWISGNSVFVPRYLSLALPGAALAATWAAARFLPPAEWLRASAIMGVVALLFIRGMADSPFAHQNSDWRAASRAIQELHPDPQTPIVYPSPFIEAKSPAWTPDIRLPAFMYAHLEVYPAGGKPVLLPFERSTEAEQYAALAAREVLAPAGRFFIYGGDRNAHLWQLLLAQKGELAGWKSRRLGPFGDVDVVLFENPNKSLGSETKFRSDMNADDWQGDWKHWKIANGMLAGSIQDTPRSYLTLRKPAGDFRLRLEYRIAIGHAAILYRATPSKGASSKAYRLDISPKDGTTGSLFEETRFQQDSSGKPLALRGQITEWRDTGGTVIGTLGETLALQALLTAESWNSVEIIAQGSTLTQILNGRMMSQVSDLRSDRRLSGEIMIALMESHTEIAIRDMQLVENGK